jgi:hypothetical protein
VDRWRTLEDRPYPTYAVTYLTRHGRRLAAIVPAEAAEALERAGDAYLTQLTREALDEMHREVAGDYEGPLGQQGALEAEASGPADVPHATRPVSRSR